LRGNLRTLLLCWCSYEGEIQMTKTKNPSDALEQIKEKAEKKGDKIPINTEIVTIIADEWDKMFSEIRALLEKELMEKFKELSDIYLTYDAQLTPSGQRAKKLFIELGAKELALKSKRIAELEAELKKAKVI